MISKPKLYPILKIVGRDTEKKQNIERKNDADLVQMPKPNSMVRHVKERIRKRTIDPVYTYPMKGWGKKLKLEVATKKDEKRKKTDSGINDMVALM